MEQLYKNLGALNPEYLLASGTGKRIAISLEPGQGTVKRGTLLYRKSDSVLFTPAASANVIASNYLAILGEDVDTDASATVAASAMAYIEGEFLFGYVKLKDGTAVGASLEPVLRAQGIIFKPLDNPIAAADEADNTATVSVTVTNDGHGTGSADPATGTKGTEVTLTATPASDYELDYWEVVSGGVTVTDNKFVIGDEAVTVKAHFKASA